MDLPVFVMDEAQFSEFVHKKIDAGPGLVANRLRQHLLGDFGNHFVGLASRTIEREEQQAPRQRFSARVETGAGSARLQAFVPACTR